MRLLLPLICVVGILVLEGVALINGVNGAALSASIGALGFIGGWGASSLLKDLVANSKGGSNGS
jgi:small-conductance mechanosensitive channel